MKSKTLCAENHINQICTFVLNICIANQHPDIFRVPHIRTCMMMIKICIIIIHWIHFPWIYIYTYIYMSVYIFIYIFIYLYISRYWNLVIHNTIIIHCLWIYIYLFIYIFIYEQILKFNNKTMCSVQSYLGWTMPNPSTILKDVGVYFHRHERSYTNHLRRLAGCKFI